MLDNGIIRAVLDADGLLASLARPRQGPRGDRARDSVGNLLELHRDTPNEWDAWDIDEFYRRNVTALTEAAVGAAGAATARTPSWWWTGLRCLAGSPSGSRSTAGSDSLGITTAVDWQESEKLLKLGFPLDVRADRSAAETQFGHVFRPTHVNTSWEAAKFEICAHRWIHVAEPGYGVAIANASTYGHDVTRNVRDDGGTTTTVRLSLLRAPKFPDPEADRGRHELDVAIRPGAGIADAVEEGYRTNLAPRIVRGGHAVEPLFTVDNPALVIEAVKLAEDGSGDVMVRLYESLGKRSAGQLTANFPVTAVRAMDLLERPVDAPGVVAGVGFRGTDSAAVPAGHPAVRPLSARPEATAAGTPQEVCPVSAGTGRSELVQQAPDELARAVLARCAQHFGGGATLHHHSAVHEDDFVGHLAGEGELVGDDHHGPALLGEFLDDAQDLAHQLRVQGRGGFVEQQELGLQGEGAHDAHALLLAAGQFERVGVALVRQSHPGPAVSRRRRWPRRACASATCTGPSMTFCSTVMWGKRL